MPRSSLVGEEGRGWALVTNQLNNERVALCSAALIQIALGETIAWGPQESGFDRTAMGAHQPGPRARQGRVPLKLINWKIASAVGSGSARPPPTPPPPRYSAPNSPPRPTATDGDRRPRRHPAPGQHGAHLAGRLERFQRTSLILTFGGGTNEVQRHHRHDRPQTPLLRR